MIGQDRTISELRDLRLEPNYVRSGFFIYDELLSVREALPYYAQVAITIAYYTGMRIGEILGLQWSKVDLTEGTISLTPVLRKNLRSH